MLVLVASVIDIVQRGPVPRWQAGILLVISVPVIVVFVFLGALVEADFDRARAIGRVPRVFVRDALLLGGVALYAWASQLGSGAVSGGGAPTGGSMDARTNRASDLVDVDVFAAALGVKTVRAAAEGFDTSYMSHAVAYGADTPGRRRPRVSITVHQGHLADARWARLARTLPAAGGGRLGEPACGSGDRFAFKREGSVVELRMHEFRGDAAQKLSELAAAIDDRLS